MKTPPQKIRKRVWSEDEHRLSEEWEQRTQEEEKKLCEEREQGGRPIGLTKEQNQIRAVIRSKAKASALTESRILLNTRLLKRGKRKLNEEERQICEQLEQKIQEGEERMRENPILTGQTTEEQRTLRVIIQSRARYHRRKREATDETDRPEKMAQRKSQDKVKKKRKAAQEQVHHQKADLLETSDLPSDKLPISMSRSDKASRLASMKIGFILNDQ